MKTTHLYYLSLFALWLAIGGCDSNDLRDDEPRTSLAGLHLEPMVGDKQYLGNPDERFVVGGATITLETARIYVSDIDLLRRSGKQVRMKGDTITVPAKDAQGRDITHTVTDKILLARHDRDLVRRELGLVPAGEYTGLRFKVGIGGNTNRVDASKVPSDHALAKQTDRNNHWDTSKGYLFIRMDGKVDTDSDGTLDAPWEIHLGTSDFLQEVTMAAPFTMLDSMGTYVHLGVDYAKLLDGVNLKDPSQRMCHTTDNLPVARVVSGNIPAAITHLGGSF